MANTHYNTYTLYDESGDPFYATGVTLTQKGKEQLYDIWYNLISAATYGEEALYQAINERMAVYDAALVVEEELCHSLTFEFYNFKKFLGEEAFSLDLYRRFDGHFDESRAPELLIEAERIFDRTVESSPKAERNFISRRRYNAIENKDELTDGELVVIEYEFYDEDYEQNDTALIAVTPWLKGCWPYDMDWVV